MTPDYSPARAPPAAVATRNRLSRWTRITGEEWSVRASRPIYRRLCSRFFEKAGIGEGGAHRVIGGEPWRRGTATPLSPVAACGDGSGCPRAAPAALASMRAGGRLWVFQCSASHASHPVRRGRAGRVVRGSGGVGRIAPRPMRLPARCDRAAVIFVLRRVRRGTPRPVESPTRSVVGVDDSRDDYAPTSSVGRVRARRHRGFNGTRWT